MNLDGMELGVGRRVHLPFRKQGVTIEKVCDKGLACGSGLPVFDNTHKNPSISTQVLDHQPIVVNAGRELRNSREISERTYRSRTHLGRTPSQTFSSRAFAFKPV
jgi:hypothetical protein